MHYANVGEATTCLQNYTPDFRFLPSEAKNLFQQHSFPNAVVKQNRFHDGRRRLPRGEVPHPSANVAQGALEIAAEPSPIATASRLPHS
jgi:hypothetical protein